MVRIAGRASTDEAQVSNTGTGKHVRAVVRLNNSLTRFRLCLKAKFDSCTICR
jgi:hypothetical protein